MRFLEPSGKKDPEGKLASLIQASLEIHFHTKSHLCPRTAPCICLFIHPQVPTELFDVPSTTLGVESMAENKRHRASPDTAYKTVFLLLRDSCVPTAKASLDIHSFSDTAAWL